MNSELSGHAHCSRLKFGAIQPAFLFGGAKSSPAECLTVGELLHFAITVEIMRVWVLGTAGLSMRRLRETRMSRANRKLIAFSKEAVL
jgi:hypothetical protein